jgi:aspartate/methionine/tyrosine aminotransferase
MELCTELSIIYEKLFNRKIDKENEILVTNGASSGIFLTLQAFCNEGDEVILFFNSKVIVLEPFFGQYEEW